MKMNNILKAIVVSTMLLLTGFNSSFAQDKKENKQAAVRNMVESQQYIFKAQYVLPLAGSQRALTSDYDLTVSKSAVSSYLPFFGRAYVAPINPAEGGIKFNSSKFEYIKEEDKKGG